MLQLDNHHKRLYEEVNIYHTMLQFPHLQYHLIACAYHQSQNIHQFQKHQDLNNMILVQYVAHLHSQLQSHHHEKIHHHMN